MKQNVVRSHIFCVRETVQEAQENVQRLLPSFLRMSIIGIRQGGGVLARKKENLVILTDFFLRENCDWIIRQKWQE